MKTVLISTLLFLCTFHLYSQDDTTSSPYFVAMTKEKGVDVLPLKSTHAIVNITGVIADVTVQQVYINKGKEAIEAIYVFPGSTNAAVYGMQMKIQDRILIAQVEEKSKAREIYTTAKTEGKRTSLLEQHRPNVFQMNVANIMPGDTIVVTLKYTELLVPNGGTYEFVYPTVVGPRYVNGNELTNTAYAAMPYQHEGKAPLYDFGIDIFLSTGVPVQSITCPTHDIKYQKSEPSKVSIKLDDNGRQGNRDFILRYALRGNKMETGMLVYEDGDEKYFLCMAQPPKLIAPQAIPPREYIFVVDISGSMNGFPLRVSQKLMRDLISGLRPYDRFNLILFAGGSSILAPHSLLANEANIKLAIDLLNAQAAGGGTELITALKAALSIPRDIEGLSRSIVLVTDGYVSVEPEAFELVRHNLNHANLFTFGIGSSVNRHLLEGLARCGQGLPEFVLDESSAPQAANRFRAYISSPLFTQITAHFKDFEVYDMEPLSIPDVMSDRPVILFGKWRGTLGGHIELAGYQGSDAQEVSLMPYSSISNTKSESLTITIPVEHASSSPHHAALKYLWARERLKRISDDKGPWLSEEDIREITSLGLKYNLLTAYTSFVAVDKVPVRDENMTLKLVKQVLPMPEHVSDAAVGFELNITGITGTPRSILGFFTVVFTIIFLLVCLLLWRGKRWLYGTYVVMVIGLSTLSCTKDDSQKDFHTALNDCNSPTTITFILGDDQDTSNMYYQQAESYFHQFTQDGTSVVVDHIRSLEQLHQFLIQHTPKQPWEEINLVVHGNRWTGMALPVTANHVDRTNAKSLSAYLQENSLHPIPDEILNHNTRVKVYGCSVGLDTALVNQFSQFFTNASGSTARVEASPYFTIFHQSFKHPERTEHLEANCYYVSFPLEQNPTAAQLERAFVSKYPNSTISWNEAFSRTNLDEMLQPYSYLFHIPVNWTFFYQQKTDRPVFRWQDEIRKWVNQQPELKSTLAAMEFSTENFWWTARPIEYKVNAFQSQPALSIKGSTRIYCVLVPILDFNNQC